MSDTIRIEVFRTEPPGSEYAISVTVYELPAECRRVLIDVDGIYDNEAGAIDGDVWGFSGPEGAERQHRGVFVSRGDGMPRS